MPTTRRDPVATPSRKTPGSRSGRRLIVVAMVMVGCLAFVRLLPQQAQEGVSH